MRIKLFTHQTIIFLVLIVSVAYGQEYVTKMRISAILVKEADKATEIWRLLQNEADFSKLAKQYTIGPNRDEGGDLGYFAPGEMMKELNDTAIELKVGEYSEPVKVENGYFILLKTDETNLPISTTGFLADSSNAADQDEPIVPFYPLDDKPVELIRVNPIYPKSAKKAGIVGTVVVKVLIDTEGNVEKVEILKSVPGLDEAAIEAARQFKFKPGKQKDKLVKVWVSIPFNFKLKK